MPVISCPLSERILGIGATWASTERPVSLSVSPQFFFYPPFVLILALGSFPAFSPCSRHAEVCVLAQTLMSSLPPASTSIHNSCILSMNCVWVDSVKYDWSFSAF